MCWGWVEGQQVLGGNETCSFFFCRFSASFTSSAQNEWGCSRAYQDQLIYMNVALLYNLSQATTPLAQQLV